MSNESQSIVHVEEALVRAACAGDRDAFGAIFKQLYGRIHRTVWGMMGNESEAHDVAQDAWIKAWNNRDRYNFQSQFSTWIHRIAVNTALDALRKRKRLRDKVVSLFTDQSGGTSSVSSTEPEADGRDRARPSSLQNPVLHAQNKELGELIQNAVQELPEDQRTVLVLREYEGYSYSEIAKALDIQPGTVMSRLHLARKKLQSRLSKDLS
ncbi:MAG: RNA polymerase sigma factor [Puniceicoccaceae bacterium]